VNELKSCAFGPGLGSPATCCPSIPAAIINGYIGDVACIAILGEPDAELREIYGNRTRGWNRGGTAL
jgi:hypothetical protein